VEKQPDDINQAIFECDCIDGIISQSCDYIVYENRVNEKWRDRIVACVNLCINIPTEDIKKGKVRIVRDEENLE